MRRIVEVALGVGLSIFGTACAPDTLEQVGLFRAFTSDGTERAFLVGPDDTTVSRDAEFFGPVDNSFDNVRYGIGPQHRAYLFQQDLRIHSLSGSEGVLGGEMLQLPRMAPGVTEQRIDITPFDSSKWRSARIYDIGECSLTFQWSRGTPVTGGQSFNQLVTGAITSALTGDPRNIGCRRTSAATIQPMLRTERVAGGGYVDVDALEFSASYHCDSFNLTPPGGVDITCGNARFDVYFRAGIRRLPTASFDVASMCIAPGLSGGGGTLQFPAGPAFDYEGVVYAASVDTSCVPAVRDGVTSALSSALPGALGAAIQNAAVLDPITLGLDPSTLVHCTCDADCAGFTTTGQGTPAFDPQLVPRPRCHFGPNDPMVEGGGTCWPQLEFDRIFVRPEGIEIVIEETPADPQDALLRGNPTTAMALCDSERDRSLPQNPVNPFPSPISRAQDVMLPWPFSVP